MTTRRTTRRAFLKHSGLAAAAVGAPGILPAGTLPNEKLHVALVGVGQRMLCDIAGAMRPHWDGGTMNVVALCDPNDRAGQDDKFAAKGWPVLRKELAKVPRFRDYRVMLDKLGKQIDGLYLTTAHHAYFPIIMAAMERGKHVLAHKPMCVSVQEARVLSEAAKKRKAIVGLKVNRRTVGLCGMRQWLQEGVFGDVAEVHICQGFGPTHRKHKGEADPVPATCDWDAFNAAAPVQPFRREYLKVRGWNSNERFSCGQAGEWGTHMFCVPHVLLELRYPKTVELVQKEGGQIVEWRFGARGKMPPATVRAYSGSPEFNAKAFPLPADLEKSRRPEGWAGWAHTTLVKGSKATVLTKHYAAGWRIVPEAKMKEALKAHGAPRKYKPINDLWANWMDACKANDPGLLSHGAEDFGPYLECVMLGYAAVCAGKIGKKLTYDSEAVRIPNDAEADGFLRREYRPGFGSWKMARFAPRGTQHAFPHRDLDNLGTCGDGAS